MLAGIMKPLQKFSLDLAPLFVFFATYRAFDIFTATAALMIATVVSLAVIYYIERRISWLPIVTAGLLLVLGGLTLWLKNDTFIKLKPTIYYAFMGTGLIGGLLVGRPLIKDVMGLALHLTEQGWKVLTYRLAGCFYALAILNEFVWRSFPTETWVTYKIFVAIPLFFVSMIVLTITIMPYEIKDAEAKDAGKSTG
jgi:intracellular septation protein